MKHTQPRPIYTPLRLKLLEQAAASRHGSLTFLPRSEEKCAFSLSQMGLLYMPAYGSADYVITKEGREALIQFRKRAASAEGEE